MTLQCTSLIEDYANDFVSEVISKATRRCVISPHHRSAGQTPDYPNQTGTSHHDLPPIMTYLMNGMHIML